MLCKRHMICHHPIGIIGHCFGHLATAWRGCAKNIIGDFGQNIWRAIGGAAKHHPSKTSNFSGDLRFGFQSTIQDHPKIITAHGKTARTVIIKRWNVTIFLWA
jgi:hypothetical protein